jgi:DNA-directed RNA polymerase
MQRMTQKDRETLMVTRGVERYFKTVKDAERRGMEWDGTAPNSLIAKDMNTVLSAMRKLRRQCRARLIECQQTGLRLGGWEHLLEPLDPESVAYIAYKTVVTNCGRGEGRPQDIATTIGRAICTEIRWREARRAESKAAQKEDRYNRIELMKRRVKAINPKSVRKWLRKFDDIATREWSRSEMFKVGVPVLAALLDAVPHVATTQTHTKSYRGSLRTTKEVRLTDEFREALEVIHGEMALNSPWVTPMIEPPHDWRFEGNKIVGGYHTPAMQLDFVRTVRGRVGHTKPSDVSQTVLDAINVMQQTKFCINRPVFDTAKKALGELKGPLPFEPPMVMPESVSNEVWAKMSREERGAVKSKREVVHTHNNRQEAKSLTAFRVVNLVEELAEFPVLYFPHSIDWRGRAYPCPQDFHSQADDFSRSMLRFAEGKPLGEHGMKWLVFHLANCYGVDKGEREDQAEWFNEHTNDVYLVATDPFGEGLEFWSKADEPWQFLAAAIEVCCAWSLDDPREYESTLPVHIDGTCNGLQHLSAMGLDPVGAKSVNLLPGPRQDIYQIVADKVNKAIRLRLVETNGDDDLSLNWVGKVTRKTVKRAVMTTPYGVTPIGIRDQLIKDGWVAQLEGDNMANANYMRDRLIEAISDTVIKGTEIMAWFQDCASILAEQDKGISWHTPTGMKVTQCYRQMRGTVVRTLMGNMTFGGDQGGEIAKRKQSLSIAPNIIHSFDAAHMMLTVLATRNRGYSYSMIHDSFGVHAGDMEDFAHAARLTFADIYKKDWFWTFKNDFQKQGAKYLTPEPERGLLDIDQVVDAEYFFA